MFNFSKMFRLVCLQFDSNCRNSKNSLCLSMIYPLCDHRRKSFVQPKPWTCLDKERVRTVCSPSSGVLCPRWTRPAVLQAHLSCWPLPRVSLGKCLDGVSPGRWGLHLHIWKLFLKLAVSLPPKYLQTVCSPNETFFLFLNKSTSQLALFLF